MADAKGDVLENLMLGLIFNATSIAGIADNDQTSPLTSLSVQLHTASPTDTGDLTSNETSYTGYTRMGVERTSSGWTVSGTTARLAATLSFPQCSGGSSANITHFSIGNSTVAASTGTMYYYGTVTPNILVQTGVTPQLTTNTAISEL